MNFDASKRRPSREKEEKLRFVSDPIAREGKNQPSVQAREGFRRKRKRVAYF